MAHQRTLRDFYDRDYSAGRYSRTGPTRHDTHARFREVEAFVLAHDLTDKRCLDIGCGKGPFQDLVTRYIGIDISSVAGKHLHKPFLVASASQLPFLTSSVDAIWTVNVLEHVAEPELALQEMRRVLKPGGVLLLAPAWQCRPWAAEGYPVRPYSDFGFRGKLIKASIPIRDSLFFRSLYVFPRRLLHLAIYLLSGRPTHLWHHRLKPNHERNWMSDSDAVSSIDPFDAILWFVSRGANCLSYPSILSALLVRTGGVAFMLR